MKTLEYKTKDKSDWGDGPWQNEPDKKQWIDQTTGLPCLIVRNDDGALCGYVGVSKDHPWFEQSYNGHYDIDVHGGLTFAEHCSNGKECDTICHTVEEGEDDNIWWFGFDCHHCNDYAPGTYRNYCYASEYCNFDYVTKEVEKLAQQLAAVATKESMC